PRGPVGEVRKPCGDARPMDAMPSAVPEVDTQGRSITEPAVSRRPIRAPPSPRTHPRRPCRTTWLQGHFTDHIQHLPSPMLRRTNMQAGALSEGVPVSLRRHPLAKHGAAVLASSVLATFAFLGAAVAPAQAAPEPQPNPSLADRCGLDIGVVLDLSNSLSDRDVD